MAEPTPAQVMRKAKKLPHTLTLVDENDVPLDDGPPVELSASDRFALAYVMLKQKQSLETVVRRALTVHLRKYKDASK